MAKSMFILFAPFHFDVWMSIVAVIGLYSLMIFHVERHEDSKHSAATVFKGPTATRHRGYRKWDAGGFLNEMYLSFIFLTVQGGRVPTTPFGKMLVLTFSLFIMVLLGAYTGNLATILTLRATQIKTFDSLEHSKYSCVAFVGLCTNPLTTPLSVISLRMRSHQHWRHGVPLVRFVRHLYIP